MFFTFPEELSEPNPDISFSEVKYLGESTQGLLHIFTFFAFPFFLWVLLMGMHKQKLF